MKKLAVGSVVVLATIAPFVVARIAGGSDAVFGVALGYLGLVVAVSLGLLAYMIGDLIVGETEDDWRPAYPTDEDDA